MFDVMMIEPHYPILSQNWNISANIPWMNDYNNNKLEYHFIQSNFRSTGNLNSHIATRNNR